MKSLLLLPAVLVLGTALGFAQSSDQPSGNPNSQTRESRDYDANANRHHNLGWLGLLGLAGLMGIRGRRDVGVDRDVDARRVTNPQTSR